MRPIAYPITIYYDASCPICEREIRLLKEFDRENKIELVDCSPLSYAGEAEFSRESMMRLIHAKTDDGQWLIGAPVFAAAYAASGIPSMAKLWGASGLQPFWRFAYPRIANNRQLISQLGLTHLFDRFVRWLHAREAKRALRRAQACVGERCEVEPPPSAEKEVR
jgi:predicted DCC family thiol-disulfide oxidoreductase YuxK